MKLVYFLDHRFSRTPDGAVWTTNSYDASFWEPYLKVFDHVTVVSRTKDASEAESDWLRVDSEKITVYSLPHFIGAAQYLRKRTQVQRAIRAVLKQDGAVIVRAPSQLANCAERELEREKRPYAVENVGDAGAALARGVTKVAGRALLQAYFVRRQQTQCRNAVASSYVANVLAERYPAGRSARTLVCSDVRLDDEWISKSSRTFDGNATRLLSVATFTQTYKGLDVLIESLAICRKLGVPLTLTLVGEGRLRPALEEQAQQLGISHCVKFTGSIPWGPALAEEYDRADLFVLPSRVEAMPRAMIEAMARALPCIGTKVGAVPELLEPHRIVKPDNAWQLATNILSLACQPAALTEESRRNLQKAQTFSASVLRPQWEAFHRGIAELTASASQAKTSIGSALVAEHELVQER